MIFPFKLVFKQKFSVPSGVSPEQLATAIREKLLIESPNNIGETQFLNDYFLFKTKITQSDLMITVEKGKIKISTKEDGFFLVYSVYIFRFFFLYFSVVSILAAITGALSSGWYKSFLIIGAILWIATVVSQRLLLVGIAKYLKSRFDSTLTKNSET